MRQELTAQEIREGVQEAAELLPGYALVLIRVGAIVLVAFLLHRLVRRFIRRVMRRKGGDRIEVSKAVAEKRAQTLAAVLGTGAAFAIWTLAVMLAVDQVPGVDMGPLIAAAGIGGFALGFGAQHLVKDVISGFFILFEDQFHVGDVVGLAGVSGVVERITLRSTVLRDIEGRVHVVPNGEIRVSTNHTKGFSRYVIDLPVAYEEDVDRVVEVVREVAEDLRREPQFTGAVLRPLEVLGVDDYAESQVVVKVYLDTIPGKQWEVGRELRRRIKRAYDAHGIKIPYPHREIIVREGEADGTGDGHGSLRAKTEPDGR